MSLITTYAGNGRDGADLFYTGPATGTSINPAGLAFDTLDNLYIADWANHLIRKVDPQGTMSIVAGDGFRVICNIRELCTCLTAGNGGFNTDQKGPARLLRLNFPQDVAADAQGNVYIADTENHRIRRLMPNGEMVTIAGTSMIENSFREGW